MRWKLGGWYLRDKEDTGYEKAAIKFTINGSYYTITDGLSGHNNVKFMYESGGVFSDHDVDITSDR